MSKKVIGRIAYIAYLILFFICADYAFYLVYRNRISKYPQKCQYDRNWPILKKVVDPLTMSRLTYILTDRKSCFINFNTKKENGIIRIGCFGDSNTYGDEADNAYDYPTLLQDIFRENGYRNVEVLNFGSSWYSFGQAFIMWKYIGQKYNLDYILLGPWYFFKDRDTKFNHTNGENPYIIHSRFVLMNKKLELIDPVGDIYEERTRNYYRFIPPFRYLRFESNNPPFLACLLPRNRQVRRNPFYYYWGSRDNEAKEIYRLLLSEMADTGKPIILSYYSQEFAEIVGKIDKKNLYSAKFYRTFTFPCSMLRGHNSPLGNQIVARQMFDMLTGRQESQLPILETRDMDRGESAGIKIEKRKLSEYAYIKLKLNNVEAGSFVNADPSNFGEAVEFVPRGHKVASLLGLKDAKRTILDGIFIPLDFELNEGMPLNISFKAGNKEKIYPLGRVRLLNPGLNIGIADIACQVPFRWRRRIMFDIIHDASNMTNFLPSRKGAKVTILLGDKPIVNGVITGSWPPLELSTINYDFLAIRSKKDFYVDVDKLSESGTFYLSLGEPNDEESNIPFEKWVKTTKTAPLAAARPSIIKPNEDSVH